MKCLFRSTIWLLALVLFSTASGQIDQKDMFTAIPAESRLRFAERLNQYVEFVLKGDQKSLLKLYDENTLCSLCRGKKECIDDCPPPMKVEMPKGFKSALIEFKPIEVKPYTYAGSWDFYVDVEQTERVSWKGKPSHSVKSKVRLFAAYQKNDWYFSLVSVNGMIYL